MSASDNLRDLISSAWVVTPIPSIVYHRSGRPIAMNLSGLAYFGFKREELPIVQEHYNLYEDPLVQKNNLVDVFRQSFDGKRQQVGPFDYMLLDVYAQPTKRRVNVEITVMPLRLSGEHGDYVAFFYRDVGSELLLQRELAEKQKNLREAETVQQLLQEEVEARSAPVIPIFEGILVLPLTGAVDSRRAQYVLESVLEQATRYQANTLIIDITGVPIVDTQVANYLLHSVKALQLLGTETVLVGISPEIAQTIVQLGIKLESMTTRADLQSGLQYALARQNLIITRRR